MKVKKDKIGLPPYPSEMDWLKAIEREKLKSHLIGIVQGFCVSGIISFAVYFLLK